MGPAELTAASPGSHELPVLLNDTSQDQKKLLIEALRHQPQTHDLVVANCCRPPSLPGRPLCSVIMPTGNRGHCRFPLGMPGGRPLLEGHMHSHQVPGEQVNIWNARNPHLPSGLLRCVTPLRWPLPSSCARAPRLPISDRLCGRRRTASPSPGIGWSVRRFSGSRDEGRGSRGACSRLHPSVGGRTHERLPPPGAAQRSRSAGPHFTGLWQRRFSPLFLHSRRRKGPS